jgi:hypothetical protein
MSAITARDILAIDARYRHAGVTDDLHELVDVAARSWTFECPTLEREDTPQYSEVKITTQDEFHTNFLAKYPFLDGLGTLAVDAQGQGVLIAGGSVGQFIRGSRGWGEDVDVDAFIYGCDTVEAAEALMMRFVALIQRNLHVAAVADLRSRVAKRLAAPPAAVPAPSKYGVTYSQTYSHTIVVDPKTGEARELGEVSLGAALSKYAADLKADRVAFEWSAQDRAYKTPTPVGWAGRDDDLLSYRVPEVLAVRTANCLTLRITPERGQAHKVQVIFRKYASLSEVLHGFDLGSSAVGYDGGRVFFTTLGRFAYCYGVNIVDVTRLSPTYEARLTKYLERGFAIAMPDLNIEVLRGAPGLRYGIEAVADLAALPFAYKSVEGNRIRLARMLGSHSYTLLSDYGPGGELLEVDDDRDFRLAYANLAMLVAGRRDFVCAAGSHSAVAAAESALRKPPNLTVKMINWIYDRVGGAAFKWGRLSLGTLALYCPVADPAAIVAGRPDAETVRERIAAAFATQRARALELWAAEIGEGRAWSVKWITENPGGQGHLLTGSVTPIRKSPWEWYGAAYWAPPKPHSDV